MLPWAERLKGYREAQSLYPLSSCERCGEPARERHHKDRNPTNNAPENVTALCSSCHRLEHGEESAPRKWPKPAYRNNTSGFKGVSWHKRMRGWCVQCKVEGKNRSWGYFETADEAAVVYDAVVIAFRGEGHTNLIPLSEADRHKR